MAESHAVRRGALDTNVQNILSISPHVLALQATLDEQVAKLHTFARPEFRRTFHYSITWLKRSRFEGGLFHSTQYHILNVTRDSHWHLPIHQLVCSEHLNRV